MRTVTATSVADMTKTAGATKVAPAETERRNTAIVALDILGQIR